MFDPECHHGELRVVGRIVYENARPVFGSALHEEKL